MLPASLRDPTLIDRRVLQESNRSATASVVQIFKCKSKTGCFGLNSTDVQWQHGCQLNYAGIFCESCMDDFEMKQQLDGSFQCVPCNPETTGRSIFVWVITGGVVLAVVLLRIVLRNRLTIARFAAVLATYRSSLQPGKITITWLQINAQLSTLLSVQYPTMFTGIVDSLARALEILDLFVSMTCFGFTDFHTKWMFRVVYLPLSLVLVSVLIFVLQWLSANLSQKHTPEQGAIKPPIAAGQSLGDKLTGRLFFVVFFVCVPHSADQLLSRFASVHSSTLNCTECCTKVCGAGILLFASIPLALGSAVPCSWILR
jgi:hypothetical protein